jgi:hypothetical protein
MAVHDWTRAFAGCFHDFHQGWITEIRTALNSGLLPRGYYAQAEQVSGVGNPDVVTLESLDEVSSERENFSFAEAIEGAVALAEHPPKIAYTLEVEADIYAAKADWVVVHHVSDDRVVALIEIVSPGNTHTKSALDRLVDKLDEFYLDQRHLLLIDLFPPGKHDPLGTHEAFWRRHYDECPGVSNDKPLTLASYRSGPVPTAYFEPISVGQPLREMPLLLEPNWYVNVPLEATYQKAFAGIPAKWKRVLESPEAG